MKIARNRRRLGSPPLVLILAFVCIPMANIYFLGYVLNSSPRLAVENNSLAENLSRGDDFSVISELVMDIPTFDEMVGVVLEKGVETEESGPGSVKFVVNTVLESSWLILFRRMQHGNIRGKNRRRIILYSSAGAQT